MCTFGLGYVKAYVVLRSFGVSTFNKSRIDQLPTDMLLMGKLFGLLREHLKASDTSSGHSTLVFLAM